MALRVPAISGLGIVAAIATLAGFTATSQAADTFSDIKIEFDANSLAKARQETADLSTHWLDLETISTQASAAHNSGMIGFDKPLFNMPDGSTATLNLGARAGTIRAGLTWNLD